jgi:hypothetical protein
MDSDQKRKYIALSNFRNHEGMKIISAELRQMYVSAIDVLERSDSHDVIIRAQAKIEAINQIAGLFEQAQFVSDEARNELMDSRLKPMTTLAE